MFLAWATGINMQVPAAPESVAPIGEGLGAVAPPSQESQQKILLVKFIDSMLNICTQAHQALVHFSTWIALIWPGCWYGAFGMTAQKNSPRGRPQSMSRSKGGEVWESVTVCDRGGGGKDHVTSHFKFFHNSQFYVLFYIFSRIIQI